MSSINKIFEFVFGNRVLLHILYWLGIIVFGCVYSLGYSRPIIVTLILLSITLPFTIMAAYLFIYWQFPLIQKRRYFIFSLSFIVSTYFFSTLAHINYDFGVGTKLISWHKPHELYDILINGEFIFSFMVDIYSIVFITMGIKLFKDQHESRNYILNLETEAANAESKLLVSKLQPDFLLNALQLIKNQSAEHRIETPKTIESLSEILDYTLYQSNKESVMAAVELEQLSRYLRLCADSSAQIEIADFVTHLIDPSFRIRPLTFVRIVETILQHQKINQLGQISISIFTTSEEEGSVFQFTLESSDLEETLTFNKLKTKISAFLDSIYQGQHSLNITSEESGYIFFIKFYK